MKEGEGVVILKAYLVCRREEKGRENESRYGLVVIAVIDTYVVQQPCVGVR